MEIHLAKEDRFAEIVEIWNQLWPEVGLDEEELVHENQCEPHLRPRFWLASQEGANVGFLQLGVHRGSYKPGRWEMELGVREESRKQGVGAALHELALRNTGPEAIESISVRVKEGDEAALRFAEQRGYREAKRDFYSVLDLVKLDQGVLDAMEIPLPADTTVVPMSTVDSPAFRHRLHALFERVRKDIPRSFPPTPLSFPDFEHGFFSGAAFLWEGSQVAMKDGEPIAFCTLFKSPQEKLILQGLTAVDADYRGAKLAQTLKGRATRWAIAQGAEAIRTDNDSRNSAMLAINRKLGFKPLPAKLTMIWRPVEQR